MTRSDQITDLHGSPSERLIRVQIAASGIVRLTGDEATELYDLLWLLAPRRGAVAAAAKLKYAMTVQQRRFGDTVVLDDLESAAFTEARAGVG